LEYFICLRFGAEKTENINDKYREYFNDIIEKSFALERFDKNNYANI